ncbi:MAG: alpha/beta hydrolase [Spirochaetia bacterium]|nr:alpha/beta hydrolase [Spirochaetia bacterium]
MTFISSIVYGNAGGTDLPLDLYLPDPLPSSYLPTVLLIHGGGWSAGSRTQEASLCQKFVQAGYIAAAIDYRLSSNGVNLFPAAIYDCKAAVRWLRANADQYHILSNRIGVFGQSAGAQLALLLAYTSPTDGLEGNSGNPGFSSRVQAVCSWYGPTALAPLFVEAVQSNATDTLLALTNLLGGTPNQVAPGLYDLASPYKYVSADDPPTFMIHGLNDRTVFFDQSLNLYNKLLATGLLAKLVPVTNAGHGFVTNTPGVPIIPNPNAFPQATIGFFNTFLKI